MCTFIFYFYIWECDLSSFPEEYCLDKFLVNISFMVIYYLILKAIAFQILSYFYWASSISVYATDTAVLCYFIFRLIFMDIAGNNISVSNFLSFFFSFLRFRSCGSFCFGSLSTFDHIMSIDLFIFCFLVWWMLKHLHLGQCSLISILL